MGIFDNKFCPVCKKQFTEDDDIIVCPECGTPHHRECYNLIGHCVNKGLHQSNYNYYDDQKAQAQTDAQTETENAKEYYEAKSEEQNAQAFPNPFAIPNFDTGFNNDDSKIFGEEVKDIAAVVRVNPIKFIANFKIMEDTNKKVRFNFSGFIFGAFYLLYRKMYKLGIAVFAIVISLFYGSSALLLKIAPQFIEAVKAISTQSVQGVYPTNEQLQTILQAPDMKYAVITSYAFLGIILIINIVIGMFANYWYKNQVLNIVKNVREQLDSGASFSQMPIMTGNMDMTQDQMRQMYLAKKGGTSIFAPAMAILLIGFFI